VFVLSPCRAGLQTRHYRRRGAALPTLSLTIQRLWRVAVQIFILTRFGGSGEPRYTILLRIASPKAQRLPAPSGKHSPLERNRTRAAPDPVTARTSLTHRRSLYLPETLPWRLR